MLAVLLSQYCMPHHWFEAVPCVVSMVLGCCHRRVTMLHPVRACSPYLFLGWWPPLAAICSSTALHAELRSHLGSLPDVLLQYTSSPACPDPCGAAMLQVKDQFGNFKTENFAELRMKAFGATDSGEPKAANGIEQAPARFVCPSLKCLQVSPLAASVLCRLALTASLGPNGAREPRPACHATVML